MFALSFLFLKQLLHRAVTHGKLSPNQHWGVNRGNCEELLETSVCLQGHFPSLLWVRNSQTRAAKLLGTLRSSPCPSPLRTELYGLSKTNTRAMPFEAASLVHLPTSNRKMSETGEHAGKPIVLSPLLWSHCI